MVRARLEDGDFPSAAHRVGETMNSKRSIVRNGQKTSVSLEKEFWEALREIASSQNTKLTTLVQHIDQRRNGGNLSSAIRVFVFNHLRAQLAGTPIAGAQDLRAASPQPAESALNC
jgi:predicted DNA-binding ribbon-helix-helix protein